MAKVFREDEITALIGEYVSVIAKVTLTACGAYAQLREINEAEAQEIVDSVKEASDAFVTAYKLKLARKGTTLSKAKTDKLRSDLKEHIMTDCWVLMQKVGAELKLQANTRKGNKNGQGNNTLQRS